MSAKRQFLNIVMVDDDQDDLFLTKRYFEKSDYDLNFLGLQSAQALFDHIKYEGIGSVHVLLLDLNMPRMGGRQIMQELKSYPGVDDVNMFIFSTSSREEDEKVCIEEGAKGYFAKPSNANQAKGFIEELMRNLNFDRQAKETLSASA